MNLMRSFPFDDSVFRHQDTASECRQYYQSGRMDMLFNLVDAGVVTLDVAAGFAKMSVEEASDMLQGWITAQKIQDGVLED